MDIYAEIDEMLDRQIITIGQLLEYSNHFYWTDIEFTPEFDIPLNCKIELYEPNLGWNTFVIKNFTSEDKGIILFNNDNDDIRIGDDYNESNTTEIQLKALNVFFKKIYGCECSLKTPIIVDYDTLNHVPYLDALDQL